MPMQAFAQQVSDRGDKPYLRQPKDGVYQELSWAQAYEQTLRLAQGLLANGLKKGDKVAIISANCADWFIADFALLAAGLIPTPIYATAGLDTIKYVLEHSEAKAIFIGSLADTELALTATPDSVTTIAMSGGPSSTDLSQAQLINENEPLVEIHEPKLDEVFSIVYTSGSTGAPKGVVLTYKNVAFTGAASCQITVNHRGSIQERYLSYLPLAHVTERGLIEYASLYLGATITFNESINTFVDDLLNAQVTFFISVPRLWVKFQSQILASMPERKLSFMLKIPILNSIIKKKIKERLGFTNTLSFGSGSAPISPSILEWFSKLDINISEGWGMSETIGLATTNYPFNKNKLGSIGAAIEGFEVRLSEQGEIQIKGDGVFAEYYRNPEATAATFTEDGFLRTGDKGKVDADGFYQITGRVKDIFKTGKGKYVAPVPIESKMGINTLIEQICIMGSGLPAAIAVIVLSKDVAEGMSREEIEQSLLDTVQTVNGQIEKHEVIGGVYVVNEEWSIANGLLTPTMKVKRSELEEKYLGVLEGQTTQFVWE